jgi:hypothetical protein
MTKSIEFVTPCNLAELLRLSGGVKLLPLLKQKSKRSNKTIRHFRNLARLYSIETNTIGRCKDIAVNHRLNIHKILAICSLLKTIFLARYNILFRTSQGIHYVSDTKTNQSTLFRKQSLYTGRSYTQNCTLWAEDKVLKRCSLKS